MKYQLCSNYLAIFVSAWLSDRRLSLGNFNRFVFEEGAREDMKIVGSRAFVVSTAETFERLEKTPRDDEIHGYFVSKCLEGFQKIDGFFDVSLFEDLKMAIAVGFVQGFKYEKPAGAVKGSDGIVALFHRYRCDRYELVACHPGEQGRRSGEEKILLTLNPDPFLVDFEVNKIEISGRRLTVINKVRERKFLCEF
ncbi:hypothetical protein [Xanthomonas bonasiae]|uniref:hypothetical protein n=1 Tax=Xanthomonas bonasiae TaxID=2810351 RepID=UPI001780BF58|nr:hypothetical protein [Xanthomonas surreyensis]MBD7922354.1 hypothetical protein [Xanthomonas surreyensis]